MVVCGLTFLVLSVEPADPAEPKRLPAPPPEPEFKFDPNFQVEEAPSDEDGDLTEETDGEE